MRFLLPVSLLLACGLALAAPIPKDKDKPKKDEDAIQGVWQLDAIDAGPGVPAPPPGGPMIRFTFKDGKLEVSMGGQPMGKQGDYKLDPAAKPKSIDLVEGGGQNAPGIYELDGDTLKICLAEGQNAVRPTEFKPDGKRVVVVTFKRVKDEKKDEKKDK